MKTNTEITVGIILTGLLALLFMFVHNRSLYQNPTDRFMLQATFAKADGLVSGNDVRLAGISVGSIGEQHLSNDGSNVIVQLIFNKKIEIPVGSSITIETDGLLGSKHLEIHPGGSDEFMEKNDSFSYTQDSLILTDLLEKLNSHMKAKKGVNNEEKSN